MKVTITLNHGPIDVEFSGEERDELEENLVAFIEFLKENDEIINGDEFSVNEEDNFEDPGLDANYWDAQQNDSDESRTSESPDTSHTETEISYGTIPDTTDISEETLERYFGIDPSAEEPPYLNFDEEVLGESGNSRSEKQMRGSLILMTLWREGNDVEVVKSPDLKDALRLSGVDDTTLYNMYGYNNDEGGSYFRRDGSGSNTKISLTLPGKREGFDQIQRTVDRLESEIEQ